MTKHDNECPPHDETIAKLQREAALGREYIRSVLRTNSTGWNDYYTSKMIAAYDAEGMTEEEHHDRCDLPWKDWVKPFIKRLRAEYLEFPANWEIEEEQ